MGETLAQKIIRAHLLRGDMTPGSEIALRIDQTLTQDATGTMAYLEFETMGIPRVKTELSVAYVDHNTLQSGFENADDHRYLQTVAAKHGVWFSRPGNGICHQVHLERFGKPGKTLIGSDSHTPTGGGIGMLAFGAGGMDVAVAMGGGAYYITMPKMFKVNLTGTLRPFVTAKDISLELLRGKTVAPGVSLSISPGSKQVLTMLADCGALTDILASGARLLECACGPCIGMGFSPNSGGVSLRTFNRNFLGRSGTKDAQVYLVSPETAVAAALTGTITDPQTLGPMPAVTLPEHFRIDDSAVLPPAPADEAGAVEVLRGPNIRPFPQSKPFADALTAELVLKVGDNITTDHIMPAGSKILPYRSNIPKLSEFCFTVCDPTFPARARAAGDGIIVGGSNYGQGSSREHAALVPMYLGIRCVVAKSFARIHAANLINAGILPLTFADPADYDVLPQGAHLRIDNIRAGMAAGALTLTDTATGKAYPVVCSLTERQQAILLAGGLLNYTKEHAL